MGNVFDIESAYLYLTELFEIELFLTLTCELILNWIVWNRTIFDIEPVYVF